MRYLRLLFLVSVFSLVGCATAKVSVLPGDLYHKVFVGDYDRDDAEVEATKAAKNYCSEHGKKEAYFVNDNSNYTGKMCEGAKDAIRAGSPAPMLMSGPAAIATKSPLAGSLLGTAGVSSDSQVPLTETTKPKLNFIVNKSESESKR